MVVHRSVGGPAVLISVAHTRTRTHIFSLQVLAAVNVQQMVVARMVY